MLPDDEGAGFDLANLLIDAAVAKGLRASDGRVHLVGISGIRVDWPSRERERGMRRAVASRKDAILDQLVWVNWNEAEAKRKARLLMRQNPEATVLWSAGDALAQAAILSLSEVGKEAGRDFLIGGVDWEPEALEAVAAGTMVASMGGHVFDGAWSLVLLYDHHHGVDFASTSVDWRTCMTAATRANAAHFLRQLRSPPPGEGRFRRFSKRDRPSPGPYRFSVGALLGLPELPGVPGDCGRR